MASPQPTAPLASRQPPNPHPGRSCGRWGMSCTTTPRRGGGPRSRERRRRPPPSSCGCAPALPLTRTSGLRCSGAAGRGARGGVRCQGGVGARVGRSAPPQRGVGAPSVASPNNRPCHPCAGRGGRDAVHAGQAGAQRAAPALRPAGVSALGVPGVLRTLAVLFGAVLRDAHWQAARTAGPGLPVRMRCLRAACVHALCDMRRAPLPRPAPNLAALAAAPTLPLLQPAGRRRRGGGLRRGVHEPGGESQPPPSPLSLAGACLLPRLAQRPVRNPLARRVQRHSTERAPGAARRACALLTHRRPAAQTNQLPAPCPPGLAQEVAEAYGLSRERIRQIEDKALKVRRCSTLFLV